MINLNDLLSEATNEFKVCDRCKGTNISTLIPKLKEVDEAATISTGCQSYCGPGRDQPFVFINNKPLRAKTEDQLIENVKTHLDA